MRMHESAREEVGWLMTLVGVVALVLGIIDVWLAGQAANVLLPGWAWGVIVLGAVLTLAGLWLHVTRPRRTDGPETSPDATPAQPQGHETEPVSQPPGSQGEHEQETTS